MKRLPYLLLVPFVALIACAAPPLEEPETSTQSHLSAATVACTANNAQIGLSGTGAGVAVAGYATAAALSIEALAAAGADESIFALSRAFVSSLGEMAAVNADVALLGEALAARNAVNAAALLAGVLGKIVTNGNVQSILKLGYAIAQAVGEGLITLDGVNPVGIQQNLDYLNDGLRFACHQCGHQWACSAGETASEMNDFDPTKDLDVDSPGITQGRACARDASFWSTSSYLDQCFSCCADAGYTDSCRAVCNAAYN